MRSASSFHFVYPVIYRVLYYNQVEGVIFRLHKAFLTLKSEWFAALFEGSAPNSPRSPMIAEGLTEQQPICLSGIKREEFEHLLGAMYNEK